MPTMRSEQGTRDASLSLRPSKRAVTRGKTTSASQSNESLSSNTDARSSGPQLAFLTTTGPPSERSQESRYVVRSHAMQAFLQDKNAEGRPRRKPNAAMEEKSIGDLKGRFKLQTWSRKSKKKEDSQLPEAQSKKQPEERDQNYSGREGWVAEKLKFTVCGAYYYFNIHSADILKHSQIIRDTLDGYSLLPMQLQAHTKKFLYYCQLQSHTLHSFGNYHK